MARDTGFYEYIMTEVFHGIDGVTSRSMFGGYGLYKDGIIFAIITYGKLFFKVDETNQADYERGNSSPFTYSKKGNKQVTLSYWELPIEIQENPDEIPQWVEKSLRIRRK